MLTERKTDRLTGMSYYFSLICYLYQKYDPVKHVLTYRRAKNQHSFKTFLEPVNNLIRGGKKMIYIRNTLGE